VFELWQAGMYEMAKANVYLPEIDMLCLDINTEQSLIEC